MLHIDGRWRIPTSILLFQTPGLQSLELRIHLEAIPTTLPPSLQHLTLFLSDDLFLTSLLHDRLEQLTLAFTRLRTLEVVSGKIPVDSYFVLKRKMSCFTFSLFPRCYDLPPIAASPVSPSSFFPPAAPACIGSSARKANMDELALRDSLRDGRERKGRGKVSSRVRGR